QPAPPSRRPDRVEGRRPAHPGRPHEPDARATLDVLPGMSFTPDSKALIVSYGGGIWRVPVDGGDATRIPFTADVALDLGPLPRFLYDVDDSPSFTASQIRDAVPSPDGRR